MEQKIKQDLEAAFGKNLTAQQLWALTKFAKNVRLRCRNNAAFNNMMGRVFPHASFREVTKQRPSWKNPGTMESYPGLQITVNGQPTIAEGEDE
jgi:hypothetical protein